jgi:hypothetical protein
MGMGVLRSKFPLAELRSLRLDCVVFGLTRVFDGHREEEDAREGDSPASGCRERNIIVINAVRASEDSTRDMISECGSKITGLVFVRVFGLLECNLNSPVIYAFSPGRFGIGGNSIAHGCLVQ